jgi:hypothetical protein
VKPSEEQHRVATEGGYQCKQCGAEMTEGWARFVQFCKSCIEKAVDELTTADIAAACEDLPKPEPK